jgi:pyridoxamine 5'-phosphate oxidase
MFFKRTTGNQSKNEGCQPKAPRVAKNGYQSSILNSRQVLLSEFDAMKRKFSKGEVPLPDFWGGYRVVPTTIEFWQGRENRLQNT